MHDKSQMLRDEDGYLVDPEDWNEGLARQLATEENLELSEAYWPILSFIREYWQDHKIAPDVRHVISHLAEKLGAEKKDAKQQLFKLFPYGYVKQACKIAGMKRPRVWSTG